MHSGPSREGTFISFLSLWVKVVLSDLYNQKGFAVAKLVSYCVCPDASCPLAASLP